jgi:hypothetical protein
MKKMSFEFTDPAQAAAAGPQIPPGAGVPPAGMQAPEMPAGMQGGQPPQGQPQEQGQPPAGGLWGSMAGNADQFGQGPDSSMFTDDMLASMVNDDPIDPIQMLADQMEGQMDDPQMQMRMMEAARRMGGF